MPTLAVTALGSFPTSAAPAWQVRGGTAFEGVKGAVVEVLSNSDGGSATRVDLYVFNPGEANSLKQISPSSNP